MSAAPGYTLPVLMPMGLVEQSGQDSNSGRCFAIVRQESLTVTTLVRLYRLVRSGKQAALQSGFYLHRSTHLSVSVRTIPPITERQCNAYKDNAALRTRRKLPGSDFPAPRLRTRTKLCGFLSVLSWKFSISVLAALMLNPLRIRRRVVVTTTKTCQ